MANPDGIAVTTAPTDRQVRELLWREIRNLYNKAPALFAGKLGRTRLELNPKTFAIGLSTDVPEQFQGFHSGNILFVVDEASGVAEDIYEAIEGSMTTGNARLLLIGNPTRRSGTFFEAFHARASLWEQIHISAFDTPNLSEQDPTALEKGHIPGLPTKEFVQHAAKNWGPKSPLYQIRVLGEFPSHGIDTLISLTYLTRATNRSNPANYPGAPPPDAPVFAPNSPNPTGQPPSSLSNTDGPLGPATNADQNQNDPPSVATAGARCNVPLRGPITTIAAILRLPEDERQPITLGVDVARYGDDRTAICIRYGDSVLEIQTYEHDNTMVTAGRVAALINELDPEQVNIDDIGIGSGVVDRLEELGFKCVNGVNVGARATDPERYANVRAELYDNLRSLFENEKITIPNDRELIGELSSIKYSFQSSGAMLMQPKNELRKHGLPSPDRSDALALAFAPPPAPVVNNYRIFTETTIERAEREYREKLVAGTVTDADELTISERRRIARRRALSHDDGCDCSDCRDYL